MSSFQRLCRAAAAFFCMIFCVPRSGLSAPATIAPFYSSASPWEAQTVAAIDTPNTLLNNPGGLRSWLASQGLTLSMDDENEFGGNVTGGVRKAFDNTGQFAIILDADWGKIAGIRGLKTHFATVTRYGQNASYGFGDTLDPSQQVFDGGGNAAFHLVLMDADKTFLNDRLTVAVGRMGLLNDFNASKLNCTFMNNAICGEPKTSPDQPANSVWPKAVWGLRLKYEFVPHWFVQTGVYANDQANNKTGWKFTTAETHGVALPLEFEYDPRLGARRDLIGRIKLGMTYAHATQADVLYDRDGGIAVLTGKPARRDHPYPGMWFVYDQMLMRNGPKTDEGLMLMLRFDHLDPAVSRRVDQYEIGLVDSGFWRARPGDSAGIIFSATSVGGPWGEAQSIALAHGLRPPLGYRDQIVPGIPYQVQRFAEIAEATYRFDLGHGVLLAPDFQYFWNVNGQRNIPNAVFLGGRLHVQVF
ncbi:carbohydrate porin [Nguyenibacter vanlangensis]|uniref:Carbohydrate porin n=1 Tax=Nguyenibacter vanlangensis TaxID=1216886 RepID=A0A7Y7IV25_9PROT|nr:carbohydrate porin [Nguyenibacter vanlangensis]NVN10603.1 carbohydrate porin [Nguyenibacter vanlangensis]